MSARAEWILSSTENPKFPFRVEIRRGDERVIALWLQDKWPGAGKQIFCLREGEPSEEAPLDGPEFQELERVQITRLERLGKQLSVVLDRPTRKRCNFLFLEKRYKNKPGSYEQIFFRTQGGMQQHRSNSRVRLYAHGAYRVLVDSGERYPWKFGGVPTERRKLAAGDYALEIDRQILAVVERKTFDNILTDFSSLQVLHAKLADLSRWNRAAMVIEAEYRDFLNPKKLQGRWPATHAARVLSELHALHHSLQIVYTGSRKAAEQWTAAFFAACAKAEWHTRQDDRPVSPDYHLNDADAPVAQRVGEAPPIYGSNRVRSTQDTTHELRTLIESGDDLPQPFSIQNLRDRFPEVPDSRIRSILQTLKSHGLIERIGSGPRATWRRA